MTDYKSVFPSPDTVIGMIHFDPLLGYAESFDMDTTLKNAVRDLGALVKGGVDAVMVENNYDTPHAIEVGPETVACMTYLTAELRKRTTLPIGISVLWNDFRAALAIARVCNASFVRIPVFVDHVRTSYGEAEGDPEAVQSYKEGIDADDILLFTDIHVKHSELLSQTTIEEAATEAIRRGSDAVIVTGRWTGDMPNVEELASVRRAVGEFAIIVGSGADSRNAGTLRQYADGVIVSTSVKRGGVDAQEINMKRSDQRVDARKVAAFVRAFKGQRASGGRGKTPQ